MTIEFANSYLEIELSKIQPDPNQPRKSFGDIPELASDIAANGQVVPILVTKGEADTFTIVDGERRYRALKQLNGVKAACLVVEARSAEDTYISQLIANESRSSLSPFDLAQAYEELKVRFRYTFEAMAARLGKTKSEISETMAILKIPGEAREKLQGVAIAQLILIARMDDNEVREKMISAAINGASVRELRAIKKNKDQDGRDAKTNEVADRPKSESGNEATARSAPQFPIAALDKLLTFPSSGVKPLDDLALVWLSEFGIAPVSVSDVFDMMYTAELMYQQRNSWITVSHNSGNAVARWLQHLATDKVEIGQYIILPTVTTSDKRVFSMFPKIFLLPEHFEYSLEKLKLSGSQKSPLRTSSAE